MIVDAANHSKKEIAPEKSTLAMLAKTIFTAGFLEGEFVTIGFMMLIFAGVLLFNMRRSAILEYVRATPRLRAVRASEV